MIAAASHGRSLEVPGQGARRVLFFGLVGLSTVVATGLMLGIVGAGGVTALEMVILGLFAPTFAWISIAFWNALIGFTLVVSARHPLSLRRTSETRPAGGPIRTRTALVMPARDESMDRVVSGIRGVLESLERTGQAAAFDVHLLSDTTDPDRGAMEEAAWAAFRDGYAGSCGLHYRRRTTNEGRKAGNIAEFCRRRGDEYDFMVVLDADSVMRGETIVELVRTMEANPGAGLIQTVPLPAHQVTAFGRLIQFAASVYSPMLATGQSFWQGDAANYWGHNAILRVEPFTRHSTLPTLAGRPPMGGEILSHDFVEAALLRRAGWGVYLLPELGGSYEEVPGNVLDFARRDRRWAQGSLQHLRLLGMEGLHPLSRTHFVLGAMGYVSSVLWLALLLAGSAYVLWPAMSGGPTLGRGADSGWPLAGSVALPGVSVLAATAVVLFLPKVLGVVAGLSGARGYGGAPRFVAGSVAEALFAIVVAPVMMMFHVRAVLDVVFGRDVVWGAQVREGRSVSWSESFRGAGWILGIGLAWLGVTLAVSPIFVLWLSPILTGMVLASPLVRWTSVSGPGAVRAAGSGGARWLSVPHETRPPLELGVGSEWRGSVIDGETAGVGRKRRTARRPRVNPAVGAGTGGAPDA